MDRLLTEMSSTFNQNSTEEPQINLNEDNTLKWRGLHNNTYASNKRRTRKSAKIEGEAGVAEDHQQPAEDEEKKTNNEGAASEMAPPIGTLPLNSATSSGSKSERVLRRTRTSADKPTPIPAAAAIVSGVATAATSTTTITAKTNIDKEQQHQPQTSTQHSTAPKDNVEELLLQKLNTSSGEEKTNAEVISPAKTKADSIIMSDDVSNANQLDNSLEVIATNGEGSSTTRQSKRVTRRRISVAKEGKTDVQGQLKRKSGGQEEENAPKEKIQDPSSTEDSQSNSATSEEKKPRLLMKIRTDKQNISIVKNSQDEEGEVAVESKEVEEPMQVVEGEKDEEVSSVKNNLNSSPTTSTTEPKRRGRKPGSSLKNKFGEKLKILPKRTGVRGQPSPEESQSLQSPQRPSRRIKPTAKILENEELRHGFEQQNSARLLGLNGE